MQRVIVVGPGGAGKSVFAARLGDVTGLPLVELDKHFWQPDLTATPQDEWVAEQRKLAAEPRWIMDGDLGDHDVLDVRLRAADTVVMLDFPLWRCAWRAARRSRENAEFWRWLLAYRRRHRPRILAAITASDADVHVLRNPTAVRRFLTRAEEQAATTLLGGEFRLGDNVGAAWVEFSRAASARTGVLVLASTTVVTLSLTIALAFSNAIAAVVLGAITVACGWSVRSLNRRVRAGMVRRRFCWYADGVVETHPDLPTRVVRWADVDSVTLTFNDADERFNGLSSCTLADGAGTTVSIDGAYPKSAVREVTDLAERMLSPRIGATLISTYDAGEPVVAGNWRIDGTGITENRRKSSWREIRQITVVSEDHRGVVDPPSLIDVTGGSRLRLSLSGVRNGLFLPHLLEHVARQQQIPVHRITVPPGKGGT